MTMTSNPALPQGDSPALSLVPATPEEILIQANHNGASWRKALSLPAYVEREITLAGKTLPQTNWILTDKSLHGNPLGPTSTTTRLLLASCKTYQKRGLVWRNGVLEEVVCHGVGSVYCAPQLRGRGYAQRLMQELCKEFESSTQSHFSVLFSDIGKKFYNKLGWKPFHSTHISLPTRPAHQLSNTTNLPTARPLQSKDLGPFCKLDEAQLRKTLASRPKGSPPAISIIPDITAIQWHHAREDFMSKHLHAKAPEIKGAVVGSEEGKKVWCYWARMWANEDKAQVKGNVLHVLRLVIEDLRMDGDEKDSNGVVADVAALLLMVVKEAEQWMLEEVQIWNPSSQVLAAARMLGFDAGVIDRETESIASLQWHSQDKPNIEDLDWIGNEKYMWC